LLTCDIKNILINDSCLIKYFGGHKMVITKPTGFFAYPSKPLSLAESIEEAIRRINETGKVDLVSWKNNNIGGKFLIDTVCKGITIHNIFICDLTYLNHNVLFELGFAIAKNKRVWLIHNPHIEKSIKAIEEFKLLTTIGYIPYANSDDIKSKFLTEKPYDDLENTIFKRSIEPFLKLRSSLKLLYLESSIQTEASIKLSQRIANSTIPIETDNPKEVLKSLTWYAEKISNAYALIAHFLSDDYAERELHNAKNSFISGLAYGLEIPLLMLAEEPYHSPLDYREILKTHETASQCEKYANEWLLPNENKYQTSAKKIGGVDVAKRIIISIPKPAPLEIGVSPNNVVLDLTPWWSALGQPNYGGNIAIRVNQLDTNFMDNNKTKHQFWQEELFCYDWTVNRSKSKFTTDFIPIEYFHGLLAENWEQTDPQTVTVHLRKGIKWHNRPPVNGRELIAHDVQISYEALLKSADLESSLIEQFDNIERVIATDRYSIVFNLKQPDVLSIYKISGINIIPAELLNDKRHLKDWKLSIGTGPWELIDFIPNSSMTLTRNPSYFGVDERYVQNRLPYLDKIKALAISDLSTACAALRTGKIDLLTDITWQQAQSLAKTNPELKQELHLTPGYSIELRCDRQPFNDIRVRKALQMAIDRKAIARSYYGGTVDGTPAGLLSPILHEWCASYNKWPTDLQQDYSYDMARARQLMTEAGYPNGFKTNILVPSSIGMGLIQIIKAYFMDIGVDMEIRVMDSIIYAAFTSAGKHDQMALTQTTGMTQLPSNSIMLRTSHNNNNLTYNKDTKYDRLVNTFLTASSLIEAKRISNEVNLYALQQHWSVNICPIALPVIWQPYLKGFSGEANPKAFEFARCWIDYDMKKSMGR
jgi:ABC-type transport system substrate-binding protein